MRALTCYGKTELFDRQWPLRRRHRSGKFVIAAKKIGFSIRKVGAPAVSVFQSLDNTYGKLSP